MSRSHVTNREAQAVCDYAAELLRCMNMPGWHILVMEEPSDEDAYASIDTIYGRHTAQLYLCAEWMKLSDESRRDTVTHEVLHLLHNRVNDVFADASDLMRYHEHAALRTRYRRETELMVDHLATFMSRTHRLEEAWATAHSTKA